MIKPEILLAVPLIENAMAALDAQFTVHRLWEAADRDAFITSVAPRVRGAATTGATGLTADLIMRLPNLEVVASYGVGTDAIDLATCRQRGIGVSNTPDVLTAEVADFAMALLLAGARRIPQADAYVRRGDYRRDGKDQYPLTHRVRGKKVGIVGLGQIGQAFATLCLAFGMEVAWYGPRPKPGVPYRHVDDLVRLASEVDYLVLTCKGGAETAGLVDAAVLKALGIKGMLVNVARGSVVDEAALVAALADGTLGAAALDVYADEPNVPPPLLAMDNVVLQPHVASGTVQTRGAMGQLVVDNLKSWFAHRKLLTPVT
ncbi:2-hydroxyacid dehydrogenase [Reyranella sp. CPCC 100927]|uniref:2-hydroxyacid dehydrogenase n=1 Tax=Reyranella sp. CPCC 100927 TaxID=2599616 RepID=UPI0011B75A0C|nr:2-hydroxyacid dehydrogenase [Reyranella sp. CPCC 100927]TWT09405.1 2-hydroxyacid dehydrogenase [Reyranella sp. CPCC 100927]